MTTGAKAILSVRPICSVAGRSGRRRLGRCQQAAVPMGRSLFAPPRVLLRLTLAHGCNSSDRPHDERLEDEDGVDVELRASHPHHEHVHEEVPGRAPGDLRRERDRLTSTDEAECGEEGGRGGGKLHEEAR